MPGPGHGATNRRTLRAVGAIRRKGLVRADLFGLAAVVARLVGDRRSELSTPQSTPGQRSAGSEALFCQANAIRRDGDGERLSVDLDLAADGLIKLRCHGRKYPGKRVAFRGTAPVPGSDPSVRLYRLGRQDIVHVPLSLLLPDSCIAEGTGGHEHFMGGLKHALQMRRVALDER